MNKKINFIIVMMILLAVAGCSGKKSNNSLTDADIRVGTDGLKMEFLQNAPPKNVFEGGSFPISLRIKNAGASNIGDDPKTEDVVEQSGIVVFGFEKAYVGLVGNVKDKASNLNEEEKIALKTAGIDEVSLTSISTISQKKPEDLTDADKLLLEKFIETLTNLTAKKPIKISGKQIFNPNGDEDFIGITAWTKKIGGQSETKPTTIFATACYPYKTILDASVCIDTDVTGQRRGQKSCKIKDIDFGDGQGAPVAITKIETKMLPQEDEGKVKPHFIIYLKNAGDGQVIKNAAIETACSNKPLSYRDFNVLNIMATLSGVELDCNPDESIGPGATEARLRDKEDMIRCTYEGKDGSIGIDANLDAYTAPLKIVLDYGYTFTISKDIIIEKVLTY